MPEGYLSASLCVFTTDVNFVERMLKSIRTARGLSDSTNDFSDNQAIRSDGILKQYEWKKEPNF